MINVTGVSERSARHTLTHSPIPVMLAKEGIHTTYAKGIGV